MLFTYLYSKLSRYLTALIFFISIIFLPLPVFAVQTTGLLAVSATVLSVCGVAATPLAFGNYSATNTSPTDATAVVTALCTAGVSYTLAMDGGLGSGGTVTSRVLTNGLNTLNYTVYSNAGRTTIWGDGTNSTSTVSGTAGLLPQTYTAYGRISAGQQSAAGVYLDAITVTLTY
jgi:spore coat protein U-like protein